MARVKTEKEPLGLESFPPLNGLVARRLYFEVLPAFASELEVRGYSPTLLASLPREEIGQEQSYLKAKLQGIEEGTVQVSEAQLVALRASLELYFGRKSGSITAPVSSEKSDALLEVLDWGSSRYTLNGNTTLASAQKADNALNFEAPKDKA